MELWLKFSNLITVGNMGSVAVLICAGIYFYYKIRRYLAQQHVEFLAYVATLTENQTAHIEACIHKLPDHPESSKDVQNGNNQGASNQPNDEQAKTKDIA